MKVFPPFRLDTVNQCFWRRGDTGQEERILLTPKTFAVLAYLVEHAGRLVTSDELLEALWPDTVVEPQTVKKHVFAVRSALGDRAKNSLFIETIPTRGYRFIAGVSETVATSPIVSATAAPGTLVGRGGALGVLHEAWRGALSGERQIVFISGEPGIGKTALAEEFQRRVAVGERSVRIVHGQCIEGYGSKEAYGPMLDALGRLCRGPQAEPIIQILSTEAPTWLAQLPALLTREHRATLQREILGATRERMVREIGDALDSITAEIALLLMLEDLHWVDDSTVDLISALARRRTPARLMLLATCRPLDAEPAGHCLKALMLDLLIRRWSRKIDLTPLSEAEVEEYLGAQSPPGLSALVHRHSEGNPLFMVAALEHMTKRNLLTRVDGRWQLQRPLEQIEFEVPEDLRHMIEAQLERLSAQEQSALELASIAGVAFSAGVISAAAHIDLRSVEDLYEELSRRHHIVKWAGTQSHPDGSVTERYEFVHALYRQVLYDRQLPPRRARLHRQIGERLAALYAQRMEDVVPELAYHFEQAADWPRAIDYLRQAAEIAGRRYAHRQADAMLARALELVSHLPEAQRERMEPQLLAILAAHRWATFDMRAIENYETLAARAADYGLIDVQARALLDLSYFVSLTSAERCLEAAQRAARVSAKQAPAMRTYTRAACAFRRLLVSGWNAQDALEFQAGLKGLPALASGLADYSSHVEHALNSLSLVRWMSGEYREARRLALEVHAKGLAPGANPNSRVEYEFSGTLAPLNLLFLGEWGEALKEFAAAMAEAQKNANDHYILWLRLDQAWLHLHALDFRSVLEICRSVLVLLQVPALRTAPGQPIGYPVELRRALIFSGSASAAVGDCARALEDLSTAANDMDRQTVRFDWYWRMPLAAGLTELSLAQGDRVRARLEAERFLDRALATEERTWQGLAWEINSRVALAERDHARASDCIAKAVSTVQGFEVPLAAWKVHATAALIEEEWGSLESARRHRNLSRTTILRLANSLPEQEPLRKIFLSAPAVARVLSRDS
jgi:DNA-binding winged helix-turn-helix (wHTH) protein/tetratricopeptide (TPR) repeat protein